MPPKGEMVLLDTNVFLRLAGHHDRSPKVDVNELHNFIRNASLNGNIFLHTTKTREEVFNVIEWQEVEKLKPSFNKHTKKKTIINNTPDFYNCVNCEVDNLWRIIGGLQQFYEEPVGSIDFNLLKKAKMNAVNHNLSMADAIIYTIAKEEGIQNIVSCDSDFTTISDPGMTLYLDSKNYTKHNSNKK